MQERAEQSLTSQLDLVKFFQRQRSVTLAFMSLLNSSQRFIINKMGVMTLRDRSAVSGAETLSDESGGGGNIIDQEKQMVRISTDMRRVLKSKALVDLRIVRMLKNKFGSNEYVSHVMPLAHQVD